MTDHYVVIGNPVSHSRSPEIHAEFARLTGQDLEYDRLSAPLDGFAATLDAFRAGGGRGANITLPFKEEAFRCALERSDRAEAAGAVNTLKFDGAVVFGDNTDGAGLVGDLRANLGVRLEGAHVLVLGAGGAARGVILPLLAERPARLAIANRTAGRAAELARRFAVQALDFDALAAPSADAWDVVINATSASLDAAATSLPMVRYAKGGFAYDMMYGKGETAFLAHARRDGARGADGLGMLVEQAAESFFVWRGVRPPTGGVLESLRRSLGGAAASS